jgi:hypothetical protein
MTGSPQNVGFPALDNNKNRRSLAAASVDLEIILFNM